MSNDILTDIAEVKVDTGYNYISTNYISENTDLKLSEMSNDILTDIAEVKVDTGYNYISTNYIKTNTDLKLSEMDTGTSAEIAAVQSDVTDIKAKTDNMRFTETNYIQSDVNYIDSDSDAATKFKYGMRAAIHGKVSQSLAQGVHVSVKIKDLEPSIEYADNILNNRVITFISGDGNSEGRGIAALIKDTTHVAGGVFTLTISSITVPTGKSIAVNDEFIIA